MKSHGYTILTKKHEWKETLRRKQSRCYRATLLCSFKKYKENKSKTATIFVCVDNTQKSTPDNLGELKLPMIWKQELEGEISVLNKIKLINTIYQPKGWIGKETLTKRLEKYAIFMENYEKKRFYDLPKKGNEFPSKENTQATVLTIQ